MNIPLQSPSNKPKKILIIYHYLHEYPIRATTRDHLYSFKKYSTCDCFYFNAGFSNIHKYLLNIQFDVIVFHTTFLSCRWGGSEYFQRQVNKVSSLKTSLAIKIALPQDEFIFCDDLCWFVNEFNISCVYSVAPPSEWPKIYSTIDSARVCFYEVLTGYLDTDTAEKIKSFSNHTSRTIDMGYRAYRAPQWLGRHGFLKTEIGERFKTAAHEYGLKTDISLNQNDTILGDDWYKFLLRCKYIPGIEGGSSILDRKGEIRKRTQKYIDTHSDASFEDIEKNCFPGGDDSISYIMLSPRQLEACATKTCQILIEGRYNQILKPGIHYLELKKDFSNLQEVLQEIKRDSKRKDIAENAYRDIVQSGRYTYKNFVKFVLETTLKSSPDSLEKNINKQSMLYFNRFLDFLSWQRVRFRFLFFIPLYNIIRKFLPQNVLTTVLQMYNKLKRS